MLEYKLGIVFNNYVNFIVFGYFEVCVETSLKSLDANYQKLETCLRLSSV